MKGRPLSYNSCKGEKRINYKTALEAAFANYNPTPDISAEELYAVIYYFFNVDLRLDTDNLSKPVWDSLGGFLFNDDKQIKVRIAGSFDLSKEDYSVIDFTGLQGNLVTDLVDAFDNEDHIIYIECGKFKPSLYKFNLE